MPTAVQRQRQACAGISASLGATSPSKTLRDDLAFGLIGAMFARGTLSIDQFTIIVILILTQ